jgi:Ca-activated chloride channel family protein
MNRATHLIVLGFLTLCGLIVWLRLGPRTSPETAGGAPRGVVASQSPVEVLFASSDGKKEWVDAVTEAFHRSQPTVGGRPIHVTVSHMRTGESRQNILDGKEKPTIWGPAGASWVDLMNRDWQLREHQPFLEEVRPTVRTGLVIALWEPMARAMGWPEKQIGWSDLVRVASDPRGWAAYHHPEWGAFRFGHAHPDYSNSAMLSVVSEIYAAAGKTRGLTPADLEKPAVRKAVQTTERAIVHYGESSSWLVEKLCTNGPAYLSALTVYESSVVKANSKYPDKPFRLVAVYPKEGTFWETHPAGIVNAAWVSAEQRDAAKQYLEFLAAPDQQARASEFGFRPTRKGVALAAPFDAEHGVDPAQTGRPELEYVSDQVFRRANELWHQVKKKATVIMVLDTSGSMNEQGKITSAKAAASDFVKRLERDDMVYGWSFNTTVVPLGRGGKASQVAENLGSSFSTLFASGGTALYDATLQAYDQAERSRKSDPEPRLYAVVLLSDGRDTSSHRTRTDVLARMPRAEAAEGTRIFSIAYGSDADKGVLTEISNASGGKVFTSGTEDVRKIYQAIAAYF